MKYSIVNGNVLTSQNEFVAESLLIDRGNIVDIGASCASKTIDASGCLVMPGIIDMHGDAFEKLITPRVGCFFPIDLALLEADRQMISSGITTGYLSFTLTWETHNRLRSTEGATHFYEVYSRLRDSFRVANKTHLRFEIYHLQGLDLVQSWLQGGHVDMISFNDHLPYVNNLLENTTKLREIANKIGCSPDQAMNLYKDVGSLKPNALEGVKSLAAVCRNNDIVMASHDEEDIETRDWYKDVGCDICEFPCNEQVARYAISNQDAVVMGAPNALNGGSLYERLSVQESVKKQICTIMASDYYYPAQLQAVFLLEKLGICKVAEGWDLVSKNVASALKLSDRGLLKSGKRADIVIIDTHSHSRPTVRATIVNGEVVYAIKPEDLKL